jgi:hypothetical protein
MCSYIAGLRNRGVVSRLPFRLTGFGRVLAYAAILTRARRF